jgi:hypothetical protein
MGKDGKIIAENYKLSEESAKAALDEVLSYYEIEWSDKRKEQVEPLLDTIIKGYQRGLLENKHDEDLGFTVIQHLKNGQTLTYRELKGKDRLVVEGFNETQIYSRTSALLGRLSGLGADAIIGLKGRDWRTAQALSLVFFEA